MPRGWLPLAGRSCASCARGISESIHVKNTVTGWHNACVVTPGILPSALRASLRLFKIAPDNFVSPLDFIARLAALVPKPRVNLTRFHGVFAPNSKDRGDVVRSKRGRRTLSSATLVEQRQSMRWAQRLKRVFRIDIEQCPCGGSLKIIACIEQPAVIGKILDHLDKQARGPPVMC